MAHRPRRRRIASTLLAANVMIAGTTGFAAMAASAPVGAMPALAPPVAGGPVPRAAPVAPLVPTRQATVCATMVASKPDFVTPPQGFRTLDVERAWAFSRGAGQKIAVIDTGVFRHPRLSVIPGGDYVSTGDGTRDCDGHGTAVAGIAAGKQSPRDGFAGVAPDAQVIAIRQTSQSFTPRDARQQGDETPLNPSGYGNVTTLARAVVHAVELGAGVINISEAACTPVGRDLRDQSLGAAVRYAYQRNVVVVSAAGNVDSNSPGCKTQNPGVTGGRDPDPWSNVVTQSSPSYFSPYVVSVASVEPDGAPSDFSLAGPWVTVAAPGTDVISLNIAPRPPVVDGFTEQGVVNPIGGTSYAAPYVTGLAALIKARFPNLTAAQVINRITRTAHHPADGRDSVVGYGLIDPVAALTSATSDDVDITDPRAGDARDVFAATAVIPPRPPHRPDPIPKYVAVGIGSGAFVLAVAAWILVRRRAGDRTTLVEGVDY